MSKLGGVTLSHQYLSIIVGTLLLCGPLYAFFNFTRIGIAIQATSQNQLAAYYMGVPVKMIFSLIWAISAGVATAAGVLLAPVTLNDVNMGLAVALKAFAAAVMGGFGSIPGALVGGITIGVIELYSRAFLPEGFKDTMPYVVLLVMLWIRPQGLFGTFGRAEVVHHQYDRVHGRDIAAPSVADTEGVVLRRPVDCQRLRPRHGLYGINVITQELQQSELQQSHRLLPLRRWLSVRTRCGRQMPRCTHTCVP